MKKLDTITATMAKRIFIQVEVTEEYKAELQRLIGRYMPMSAAVRQVLEEKYPTLKAIAVKEDGINLKDK